MTILDIFPIKIYKIKTNDLRNKQEPYKRKTHIDCPNGNIYTELIKNSTIKGSQASNLFYTCMALKFSHLQNWSLGSF